jgi:UDP-2-acetamido-2-deoxy-ribo-hexuluronate aminotransferase
MQDYNQPIKMIDLAAEYQRHQPVLQEKIIQVLARGNYIKGEEVALFEQNLANYLQVKHVISCGNGTDALQIALMALNIGVGDEVIIPAFTYIAAIEVVSLLGATPVLVDVDPIYFQMDAEAIEKVISTNTKAIIPVHLFGQCGNLDEILQIAKKYQIPIIEDNAQALGAKYSTQKEQKFLGSFGDIGCTSFFPTKNLACFGDGGALFTNDDILAEKIRMIANHGQKDKYQHEMVGVNSRLDTLQAAILNFKLSKLEQQLAIKKKLADQYLAELSTLKSLTLPKNYKDSIHTWHQFTIQVAAEDRDELKSFLSLNGIESMIYYPKPVCQQRAYQQYDRDFPIAKNLSTSVLSLPIHALMQPEDISYISTHIKKFFNARN